MIALLCKAALILFLIVNLYLAVRQHGRLIGYIVQDYKEGYVVRNADGSEVERPPQVLAGAWQRSDSTPVILSTIIMALLMWGAGLFT